MNAALLREAVASARSQLVASTLTFMVVAGMCAAVLLTTGRTVAAEEAALGAIDAAGTRSIIVRSSDQTSLTAGLLNQLTELTGVESVAGFGPVSDVRNAAFPGGEPAPARTAYGTIVEQDTAGTPVIDNAALASPAAAERLGLVDGVGSVVSDDGMRLEVIGDVTVPEHLGLPATVVLLPSSADTTPDAPLALLALVAESPGHVAPLTEIISAMLSGSDPQSVTIETSEELASVRQAVAGELGRYGRGTVLGILAVTAFLVSSNMLALVTMRRKDFGRRRALGATRRLLITLLLSQVAITAGAGAISGCGLTAAVLSTRGDALPSAQFTIAVAVLAVLCAMLAALPPALWAARRDPLHELRVP